MVIVLLLAVRQIDGGLATVCRLGIENNKFQMFDMDWRLSLNNTFPAALALGLFVYLPGYTTSQITVQRYLCVDGLAEAHQQLGEYASAAPLLAATILGVGVGLSFFIGILLGGLSGFYSGWVDNVIQRGIELLRSMPTTPLWMGLAAALPSSWTPIQVFFGITVLLSLIGWTGLARVVRGRFLALRTEDFVMSARLDGNSTLRIIRVDDTEFTQTVTITVEQP